MAEKPSDKPDFDTLMALYRKDPDAFDQLRQQLTTELVESAPPEIQQRLAGLQFRINMELRRAGNPTAGFLRLSSMMYDAFDELNYCLNHPLDAARKHRSRQHTRKADILPLNQNLNRQNTDSGKPH